ncbi:hypothetical protein GGH94_003037 [Coemansia aciculifera]|uniref:Uncharacterized protein n=1 Tax=Coemansia aciculifera TaxID=417176 RepID=A0A9W8M4V7_9FUNG|nr:hypothetical protein GGH94_003037 [Coemansia aciculifera]
MKFALAVLSVLALAALSVPGNASTYAQARRDIVNAQFSRGQSPRDAVHITDDERAQTYSLGLLNRLSTFVADQSAKGHVVANTGDILLADLGLDSPGSKKSVRELYNKLTVKLSEKYQYTFKDGSKSATDTNILSIPFERLFDLNPASIRYVSKLLDTFSHTNVNYIERLAPMFGVDRQGPVTSESLQSVSRLIGSISIMNSDSLALISQASGANSNDPLVKSSDIFSLAQLLEIDTRRINRMADLVDKLASMDAGHMSQYLKEVGWTGNDAHSVKVDATSASSAQSIPGMSYMLLIKDPMLEAMTRAANTFTPNAASSTAQLKPAIQAYLQQTRDALDYIPGYNAINALAGFTNNPAIAQLTQLIGLSYKYPTASYLELVLLYYRSIGMPGLDNIINYPSQFVGNIASTVVGGFISNAISGLVAGILDPKSTGLPTPSTTDAKTRTGSMSPAPTPFPASVVSSVSPVSSGAATPSGASLSQAASVSSSACNYFNPFNLFGGCSGPSSKSIAAPLITAQAPSTVPPARPSSSSSISKWPVLPSSSATPHWSPTSPLLPTAPWQPLLPHPVIGLTPNPTVTVASTPSGSVQTPASVLSQWSSGLLQNTATPAVSSATSGTGWWSNFFNYINVFGNGNANEATTSPSPAVLLSTRSPTYYDPASSSSALESKASSTAIIARSSSSADTAVISLSPATMSSSSAAAEVTTMHTMPAFTTVSTSPAVAAVMSTSPAVATVMSTSLTVAATVSTSPTVAATVSTSSVAAAISTLPPVAAISSSSTAAQVASLPTPTSAVALTSTKTAAPASTKTSSSPLRGTVTIPHQSRQSISTATIVYKQNVSTRMTYTLYSQPATVIVSFIPEDYE